MARRMMRLLTVPAAQNRRRGGFPEAANKAKPGTENQDLGETETASLPFGVSTTPMETSAPSARVASPAS